MGTHRDSHLSHNKMRGRIGRIHLATWNGVSTTAQGWPSGGHRASCSRSQGSKSNSTPPCDISLRLRWRAFLVPTKAGKNQPLGSSMWQVRSQIGEESRKAGTRAGVVQFLVLCTNPESPREIQQMQRTVGNHLARISQHFLLTATLDSLNSELTTYLGIGIKVTGDPSVTRAYIANTWRPH